MVEGTYSNEFGDTIDVTPYEWIDVIVEAPRGQDGQDAGGGSPGTGGSGGYISARIDTTGFNDLELFAADQRLSDAGDGGAGGSDGGSANGDGGDGAGTSAIQAVGDGTWLVGAGGGGGGAGDGDPDFGGDHHGGGGGAWGGAGGNTDGDNPGEDGESGPAVTGGDGGDGDSLDDPDGHDGTTWSNSTYVSNVTATDGGSSVAHTQSEIEVTNSSVDLNGPSNLAVDAKTNTSVDLSWTDNDDNEDGFYVYRDTQPNVSLTSGNRVADLAANTTTYTDSGLTEGVEYHYVVTSYIQDEESAPSNEVAVTTDLPTPETPTLEEL